MTVLEGAGVLHRPFLRSFRGVGIFSVARHVFAQQLGAWALALQLARTSVLHAKEALVLRDSIHGVVVEEAKNNEEIRPRGGGKKRTRNEFC